MTTPAELIIRDAMAADIPAVVGLLADDERGRKREVVADPLPQSYADAFAAITADPRSKLVVAELDRDRRAVGTMQLAFIPGMTYQGSERLIVMALFVAQDFRGQGIGEAMIHWAIDAAKARGCRFISINTHKSRERAHKFYKRLGFKPSHVGFTQELAE